MSNGPYEIKAGDTAPLEFRLSDRLGYVNIFGSTVTFSMTPQGKATPVITGACTILDDGTVALRGKGVYNWAVGATSTPGVYDAEFRVVTSGVNRTFPNDGYEQIVIRHAL